MIDFTLTPEQKALRSNAQSFAQSVLSTAPSLYAHLPTQNERFQATLPIYRAAVKAGLIKGQIPTPLGGTSTSFVDAALVVEEFHAVEPSTAITILGTGLGLTPLILGGSPAQHEKFLTPFLEQEGEMLASFAHSEPGGTANWLERGAAGLQTTAYKEGEEWVIDGEKLWTTNSSGWDNRGAHLTCLVCRKIPHPSTPPQSPFFSDPSSKIMILLVTKQDIASNPPSAYTILSHPDLRGHASTSGPHTRFTGLRIPHSNLLAPPGTGAALVERTFALSAALVGAMCTVADALIDVKLAIDAARCMTWRAMCVLQQPPTNTDVDITWQSQLEVAVQAKVWCSEQVVPAVQKCMGVVGISSYGGDMPFMKILNDAAVLPLFDGGNVGVRRRQLQGIMEGKGYRPWEAVGM